MYIVKVNNLAYSNLIISDIYYKYTQFVPYAYKVQFEKPFF